MDNVIAYWKVINKGDKEMFMDIVNNEEFTINDFEKLNFKNRQPFFCNTFVGRGLNCDGYSIWSCGKSKHNSLNEFSISAWVMPKTMDKESTIITNYSLNHNDYIKLYITQFGEINFLLKKSGILYVLASKSFKINQTEWLFITITYDSYSGWLFMYVNGIEVSRLQVVKNIVLENNEDIYYIGTGNESFVNEKISLQCFNGIITELKIYNKQLDEKTIYNKYKNYLHNSNGSIPLYIERNIDRNVYINDVNRPQFHLIAPGKWMNEPHAPIYFNGYYHLFYQANPNAPVFSNIKWGHLISKDMVHWKDLPIALDTFDNSIDLHGCWSGSACFDERGIPALFYTAGNNKENPNQMVAIAKSTFLQDGDERLINWEKRKTPIVKQTKGIGWFGEFRDPFVWKDENVWYMIIGTGSENLQGGNAVLYTSQNMMDWTYSGNIMDYDYQKYKEVGQVWELPVLLPLRDENNIIRKHILTFCSCRIDSDVVEIYYYIGTWDKNIKKFIKDHEEPRLFDLGNGTFTGGCGFVTPGNRSIFFTISQGKREYEEEIYSGWAHNGGIPLELYLNSIEELNFKPIKELKSVRKNLLLKQENICINKLNELIKNFNYNMLEIKIITISEKIEFGFRNQKNDFTSISYDKNTKKYSALFNNIIISKFRGPIDEVMVSSRYCLDCYLDFSMLECFLDNKKSITIRNYCEAEKRKLIFKGNENIESIEIWELESAYK